MCPYMVCTSRDQKVLSYKTVPSAWHNGIGILQDNCEDKYVDTMTANFGANKYSGSKTTGTIPLFVFGLYHCTHKRAYTVYI